MGNSGSAVKVCTDHQGGINWLSLSPDGQRLLTGSEDGTARLWSTADSQCHGHFQGTAAASRRAAGLERGTGHTARSGLFQSLPSSRNYAWFGVYYSNFKAEAVSTQTGLPALLNARNASLSGCAKLFNLCDFLETLFYTVKKRLPFCYSLSPFFFFFCPFNHLISRWSLFRIS